MLVHQRGPDACGKRGNGVGIQVTFADGGPQNRIDDLESRMDHGVGEDGTQFGLVYQLADGHQARELGLAGEDIAVCGEDGQQVLSS
ncbi:hypothetical protein MULP_04470 [Mycobacterium liflandii 128FXT]|uniref:Uncharacterized protein n=1 Tax=Mycobacterium liflandii (strain 128FXT) TaxID=459424 RepID=L7VF35_MYCL1|nr:hypothetical protein MULP_04470 [Mycobacterium liflandii 128FXT]BBA89760.1 hypothetical protein MPSD_44110 [Mycobacterium pseudoshottsii JCM 15466]